MKFFLVAFALFGVLHAAPAADDDLADKVQKIIDQVLSGLPASVGVKGLDLSIPENSVLNGNISIEEISLSGIKDLETKLTYSPDTSKLDFTLNHKDIALVIDYTVELEGLFNAEHHLSIHVDLVNLKNEGYAVVDEAANEVSDLSLLLTLDESNFDIKGLLNNDELSKELSDILTKNVAGVVDAINPILAPYFSTILKDIINVALKL
ncbi:hypothetical protein NQ317_018544 [Molorchus minor]|uniref:Uncharacterized protein n=1 Tax=Molorchus minor TaxID=1323400 RepID=A0ABQ9JWR2_9CUCU|nr:hypothetical protein NQ317_018544 [Molorchus minor]